MKRSVSIILICALLLLSVFGCGENGIEDIELLKLAEELLGREWVDSKVAMVSPSLAVHTDSVDTFNEVRKTIGDAIAEAIKNNQ